MSNTEPHAIRAAKISRTTIIIAAIIALSSVLITTCLQYIRKPDEKVEYNCHVVDANTLQPIADAKIALNLEGVPPIVYSDSEGVYQLKVAIKSKISGQIRVDAQRYQVYIGNIIFSPDVEKIEDIRLVPVSR